MPNDFVSARFPYRVEVSLSFSWINFFLWVPFGQSMLSRQRIQFYCYCLLSSVLLLLDTTISWVQQMQIQQPCFCCSLAFSVPLSGNKWSIMFKTIFIVSYRMSACTAKACVASYSPDVLSQSSKERDAQAKPTPFSGYLLLHCFPHLHTLGTVLLKAWWMVPCSSILAFKCLSKIKFRCKQGGPSFCTLSGMSSAGTCKMSQGWSQPCFSFASISSLICDSCQTS